MTWRTRRRLTTRAACRCEWHDRNQSSYYRRILAGIDVPASDAAELEVHLAALGYAYWEESDNPAYAMILA